MERSKLDERFLRASLEHDRGQARSLPGRFWKRKPARASPSDSDGAVREAHDLLVGGARGPQGKRGKALDLGRDELDPAAGEDVHEAAGRGDAFVFFGGLESR
jgi:hypothetical protein